MATEFPKSRVIESLILDYAHFACEYLRCFTVTVLNWRFNEAEGGLRTWEFIFTGWKGRQLWKAQECTRAVADTACHFVEYQGGGRETVPASPRCSINKGRLSQTTCNSAHVK